MICVVAALGASPFLPPLLRFDNGSRVKTGEEWLRTRRPQVSALAQDILLGRVPDSVPALVGARPINTTRTASYAGALDARVMGVASVAGFTPMRTDSADRGTGGLARLASMHALAPRLGLYVGDEASVPFDYGELLAAIAPRPTLLYTPKRDRDATFADVAVCVDEVRPAWGTAGALRNPRPDDYSRLSPEAAAAVVEWAKAAVT